MIVRKSYISRFFTIKRTIAFYLVSITTGIAIKEIAIVHPYIFIVLLQANIIAFAAATVHGSDVPDFDIGTAFNAYTPAISHSIVAYTFKCNIRCGSIVVLNYQIAIQCIGGNTYISNHSDSKRTGIFSFFNTIQYGLYAHTRVCISTCNGVRHSVFRIFSQVDNHCIVF